MKTHSIFQSIRQGIVICDRQGRIVYFNEAYSDFIGERLSDVRGKQLRQIRKHARVPEVLRDGRPIEGILHRENGQEYFANIYPIVEDGAVTGTVSIVTTIAQRRSEESQYDLTLKDRVRQFEKEEISKMLDIYGWDVKGRKTAAKKLGISLSGLYAKLSDRDTPHP